MLKIIEQGQTLSKHSRSVSWGYYYYFYNLPTLAITSPRHQPQSQCLQIVCALLENASQVPTFLPSHLSSSQDSLPQRFTFTLDP